MERRALLRTCFAVLAVAMACKGQRSGGTTSFETFGRGNVIPVGGCTNGSTGGSDGGIGLGGEPSSAGAGSPQGGSPVTGGAGGTTGAAGDGGDGGDGGTTGLGGAAPLGPPIGPPGPRFIGRFTSDAEFAWSGSAIELRFKGSAISVTLDDWGHNYFEIVVDGAHHVLEARADVQTYELAKDLGPGEHEVVVYRRTEGYLGPSQFLGFSVPESDWLPSRLPAERRVEIVADSTAVGYGIEGANEKCGFEGKTENNYLAYGELTARVLGAEVRTLGWSGIGIYRDNSGHTENNMGLRYGRALPTEDWSTWDFSRWIPQAVVVNLGSNDFVTNDPGPIFEDAYNALLTKIRANYAGVRIYCAVGSSLFDSEYPRLKPRLEAIVAKRAALGENVAFLDFGTTDYDDSYACDWHPSKATHELMASILAAALRKDLGW